jgi:hypothetical protein
MRAAIGFSRAVKLGAEKGLLMVSALTAKPKLCLVVQPPHLLAQLAHLVQEAAECAYLFRGHLGIKGQLSTP